MNLKDFMISNGYTPGARSVKSTYSQATASTTDMPDLNLPPISPIMDTPAASSVMMSARADVDAPRSIASSTSTPIHDGIASSIVRWRKGEKIGVGSQGCVHKALNLSNGHIFVVKESVVNDKDYQEKLQKELDICKDLVHRNIVRCLGHECVEHHMYVQLEYISGGSLRGILSEFGPLEMELLPKAMRQLLEGLQYLHSRSPPVVHRDIKSANVLVGQDFCLKLADFGCSKRDDITTSYTTTGSVLWMAPEVIRGNQGGHGRKADIWSLGCVFIEMATAEKPWGNNAFENFLQAMRHIDASDASPPIPATLPGKAYDLISQCVQRDPHYRPKASELLVHDFVRTASR
jgi:mitogen-activated protein kinase kinase kinase